MERSQTLPFIMLALTLSLLAAPQSTWHVDASAPGPGTGTLTDPYSRVDYAVSRASTANGDTLLIADGVYPDEEIMLGSKELTLEAAAGASPVLLSSSQESILTAGSSSELMVRGLRFEGAAPQGSFISRGGGIHFTGDALHLENCSMAQLSARDGGAIFAVGGSVTLDELTVESTCLADGVGGGIWLDCQGATIMDSSLSGRSIYSSGGAIHLEGGSLTVTDSTIAGNAYERGGGLHVAGGDLTLRNCDVTGSSTEDYFGGGLFHGGNSATIEGCEFHDCRAIRGGAIFQDAGAGPIHLRGSRFTDNRTVTYVTMSSGAGGALHVHDATIERCTFRGNGSTHHPSAEGGAIFGRATVTQCTFASNVANAGASDVAFPTNAGSMPPLFEGNIILSPLSGALPLISGDVTSRYNVANFPIPGQFNILGAETFWSTESLRLLPDSLAIDVLPTFYGSDPDGTRRDAGAFPFDRNFCGPACDGPIGTESCIALPNSTGTPSSIHAFGSTFIPRNRLVLNVENLPGSSMGYFIASQTPDYMPGAGGSAGAICLGGTVLRFNSTVLTSTPNFRSASFRPHLNDLPGSTIVLPGDLWYFQFWHRDTGLGLPTSNFSPSLAIQF